ncbi:MAG: prepilin peptidase [bacterium]|nr:prepilin peptidase [bacterium]
MAAAPVLAALAVWGAAATWLAIVDLRTGTLPTRIIWSAAGIVWALLSVTSLLEAEPRGLREAALGAAICSGALALVHFAHAPSMGFGDVRLALLNGMLCGWWGWRVALLALAAGFLAALPEAIITLARHGIRASRPLGPYLIAGTAGIAAWSSLTAGLVPLRDQLLGPLA